MNTKTQPQGGTVRKERKAYQPHKLFIIFGCLVISPPAWVLAAILVQPRFWHALHSAWGMFEMTYEACGNGVYDCGQAQNHEPRSD